MVDNTEVPRFPDQNDEDRKQNIDGMVSSLRHETHMSCESTDILTDNTYQATHPWFGGVRGNVMNTQRSTTLHVFYMRTRMPMFRQVAHASIVHPNWQGRKFRKNVGTSH